MELRGHRRAKKPQSGFFNRYYYSIRRAAPQGGKYGKQRLSRPFPGKKTERGGKTCKREGSLL